MKLSWGLRISGQMYFLIVYPRQKGNKNWTYVVFRSKNFRVGNSSWVPNFIISVCYFKIKKKTFLNALSTDLLSPSETVCNDRFCPGGGSIRTEKDPAAAAIWKFHDQADQGPIVQIRLRNWRKRETTWNVHSWKCFNFKCCAVWATFHLTQFESSDRTFTDFALYV